MEKNFLKYFAFCLFLTFSACSEQEKREKSPEQSLTLFVEDSVRTLDPLEAENFAEKTIAKNCFMTLYEIGEDLQIYPALAAKEETDTVKKIYTFEIKKGFYFRDDACFMDKKGREVTAKDVISGLTRFLHSDRAKNFKHYFAEEGGEIADALVFFAKSKYVFEVRLRKNFPQIKEFFAQIGTAAVPYEALTLYENKLTKNPVGCGAFYCEKDEESGQFILKKNEQFPKTDTERAKLPYLDKIYIENKKEHKLLYDCVKKGTNFVVEGDLPSEDSIFSKLKSQKCEIFELYYFCSFPDSGFSMSFRDKSFYADKLSATNLNDFFPQRNFLPEGMPRTVFSEKKLFSSGNSRENVLHKIVFPESLRLYERVLKENFTESDCFFNEDLTQRKLYDGGYLSAGVLRVKAEAASEAIWYEGLVPEFLLNDCEGQNAPDFLAQRAFLFPVWQRRAKIYFEKNILELNLHPHHYIRFEQVSINQKLSPQQ
jgi:hypothetical protein